MSPLKKSNNIAARMGRWSASHWKTAVFGWLAFVVASRRDRHGGRPEEHRPRTTTTSASRSAPTTSSRRRLPARPADRDRADPEQEAHGRRRRPSARPSPTSSTPSSRSTTIKNLRSPLEPGHADQISADGRTVMVLFDMKGDDTFAKNEHRRRSSPPPRSVAKAHPDFYVGEAGAISSSKALDKMFKQQLAQAGERSVPLTLLVLLLVFGAVVAAGVPLLLALSAVIATIGLVALPSHIVPMDENVSAVLLLVGLAVGVDYSLFYLKREREERAAGKVAPRRTRGRRSHVRPLGADLRRDRDDRDGRHALLPATRRTSRSGIATMMVVGVAMLGSLTVLPALLSKLGDRVEKGRIPFLHRLRRDRSGDNRFWSAILTPALRHPARLGDRRHRRPARDGGARAEPAHRADRARRAARRTHPPSPRSARSRTRSRAAPIPRSSRSRPTPTRPSTTKAIAELKRQALASGQMSGPIDGRRQRRRTRPSASRSRSQGTGTDAASNAALDDAPQRDPPGHDRARSRARATASRAARRPRPTPTRCSSTRRRSCSASCSRSRSSCC